MTGNLLAVSDLHVSYPENRRVVEQLRPETDEDWLIVAGDVAEKPDDIEWTLRLLRDRFATVVWAPGNHELWSHPRDPVTIHGEDRYRHLVKLCRELDVITPEDPYPTWHGPGGPVAVAPLFLLYDYSFLPPGIQSKEEGLAHATQVGVVCTDEFVLNPDPYPTRDAWCRARVALTEQRLAAVDPELPLVLVNHYPLVREPTRVLRYPIFAMWCGTTLTADWHTRFRVAAMVYGHLHIPRTTYHDGVRFEEVSLGYPREWQPRGHRRPFPRRILPEPQPSEGQV